MLYHSDSLQDANAFLKLSEEKLDEIKSNENEEDSQIWSTQDGKLFA